MSHRSYSGAEPALILLTATIAPPIGVPALTRTDPSDRRQDYERALRFYLELPDAAVDRIVFADNSDADLGSLEAVVEQHRGSKDVELLSFYGLDYPVEHGRGVGETRLIERALAASHLLAALGEDRPFWKITGRLRIRNLEALVARAPAAFELYADFRRFPRPWVDTRMFACTPRAFHSLFLPRIGEMRHDLVVPAGYSAPEEWLFAQLLAERSRHLIVPRLRTEPVVDGYSGQGADYGRASRRLWSAARGVSRKLVPGLWI